MVKYCKRCLYSSAHPLGIVFDESGVCSGCRVHEEKNFLDWDHRWNQLEKLVSPYRSREAKYDCIVPVSGGRDSFFILHNVVNKLKLKPLAVAYNKYFNTPAGIDNLARLRIEFDVDFQLKNVDPRVVKKITRKTLYAHGNPYWHCLAGETVFPVQTAVHMKIPLIIWGAHQGLEQVGMYSHLHNVEMTRRYRKDHDLFGVGPENLISPFDDLCDDDTLNYRYPAFSDIEQIGVRGIYLGNYVRWDPYAQHLEMADKFGYRGAKLARTFDKYDHADCYVYSNLHDVLKYFKHGYSKVTDQVCREVRFGRLTRENGAEIIAFYEKQQPLHMDKFCEWLGVDEHSLSFVINRHRNEDFWQEIEPNQWTRKFMEKSFPSDHPAITPLNYPNCNDQASLDQGKFITVGKGIDWPPKTRPTPRINSWI